MPPCGIGFGSWLRVVRAFAEFADSERVARSPLAVGHFEQLLVDGLLDAQPHMLSDAVAGRGPTVLPHASGSRGRGTPVAHMHLA